MLTINEIRSAIAKVGNKYHIKNAYLFGSYAKGTATENSDVDILIDDGGSINSLFELSGFRLDLIDELGGTNVDVLTASGIRPRFFEMIKDDRILLYEL
ncbi:nucleotidyltransferase domain-containing protein [Candidatus Saccharibacteria bacterium]|nr:nucleotidyltransferase domain-containing protein [Candidatus Saccharibacteria bacterium]